MTRSRTRKFVTLLNRLLKVWTMCITTDSSIETSNQKTFLSKAKLLSRLEISALLRKSGTQHPLQSMFPLDGIERPRMYLEAGVTTIPSIFLHLAALWLNFTLLSRYSLAAQKWISLRKFQESSVNLQMKTGPMLNVFLTASFSKCLTTPVFY